MKKYRIHVFGLPHTKTNLDYTTCAFTQKAYKFCKMMHQRGHYIINYGVEGSNPECDENVVVVSNEIFEKEYGNKSPNTFYNWDNNGECYQTFYKNSIEELGKRKQEGDICLAFWGLGIQPIVDAHKDMIWIHPGIGYCSSEEGIEFRVFESNMIRSTYYGMMGMTFWRNTDTVIPNYFDNDDFIYKKKKQDYFLYLGRVYDGKGLDIALKAATQTGIKLKVAGQLADQYADPNYQWPACAEYLGIADRDMRKELMANAKGSFLLTKYNEPFGGVQIENFLSGTPMITTNNGCFTETNLHGITGYRCNTFIDVINAINNIKDGKIKSKNCRRWGETYLLENIAPLYEQAFERFSAIHYLNKENNK